MTGHIATKMPSPNPLSQLDRVRRNFGKLLIEVAASDVTDKTRKKPDHARNES